MDFLSVMTIKISSGSTAAVLEAKIVVKVSTKSILANTQVATNPTRHFCAATALLLVSNRVTFYS